MKFLNAILIIFGWLVVVQVAGGVHGFNCTNTSLCNHGKCIKETTCACDKGFATVNATNQCNYEQKKKLTAFLLSFFIGVTGADWFYLAGGRSEYITIGVVKLLLFLAYFGFACIPFCLIGIMKKSKGVLACLCGCLIVLLVLMTVANMIWALADWIRILVNKFPDGNGILLEEW